MTTMNTEPSERDEASERIYIHPTSPYYQLNKWPFDPGEYVEYVRADLAAARDAQAAIDHWASMYRKASADNTELVDRLARVTKDGDLISRKEAVKVAYDHDRRHDSGYRCYEGEVIAKKIAALPACKPDIRAAAEMVSRAITEAGFNNSPPPARSWEEGKHDIPAASSPAPAEPPPCTLPDRYQLADAIRVAFLRHGHDAWVSVAQEVMAVFSVRAEVTVLLNDVLEWLAYKQDGVTEVERAIEESKLIERLRAAITLSPAEPAQFVSEVDQWKHDLTTAGWVAETALNWRAPDGTLWRGPAGAWKELQRRNATAAPARPEGEQEQYANYRCAGCGGPITNGYCKPCAGKREVQCADCLAWFNPDSNHTCRQQVRRNQRSAK